MTKRSAPPTGWRSWTSSIGPAAPSIIGTRRGRADCYTDDAVYEYEGGERTVGREAFIEKLSNAADPQDSLHWTTNHIIEGTSTAAKGLMYFAVYYQKAVAATGTYSDTYRKVDGEWRIASRYVVVDRAP